MYRRPKFLEILLEIRREMAAEADFDVDLFAERVRSGMTPSNGTKHELVTNGDAGNAEDPPATADCLLPIAN